MSGTHLVCVKSFILPPRHLHQKDSHLSDGELWLRGEAVCPRSLPTVDHQGIHTQVCLWTSCPARSCPSAQSSVKLRLQVKWPHVN